MSVKSIENVEVLIDIIDKLAEKYNEQLTFEAFNEVIPRNVEGIQLINLLCHIGMVEYNKENGEINSITVKERDYERIKVRAENLYLLDEEERETVYLWIENNKASPTDLEEEATLTTLIDQIRKER